MNTVTNGMGIPELALNAKNTGDKHVGQTLCGILCQMTSRQSTGNTVDCLEVI